MGLSVLFALAANGVGVGAALTATYGVLGGALIKALASTLLNAGIAALTSKSGSQQDTRQRIAQQVELPFIRHVHGRCFATGTPTPGVSSGGFYYVAYLVNSRESEGNFELYLDKRVVQYTGNPYDFSGSGAVANNSNFAGHVSYWVSNGDQLGPPAEFISGAGYDASDTMLSALGYKSTDAGRGCTTVWLKLKRGTDGTFQDRWPSYPYVNLDILGDWSKVWDPRDETQTATDASTHKFSRNQGLIGLDVAMRNPFRPYVEDAVDLDMWVSQADISDISIHLKSGGSEPQFQCGGTTLFDGTDLNGLLAPIMAAGGTSLVRSSGPLGIVPCAAKTPVMTISEMIGLPSVSTISGPESQFDEVHVTYAPLDRDGEPASLKSWSIPGVVGDGLPRVMSLDLSMVGSATQAMRLRKIAGLKTTYMRTLDGMAWPEVIEAVAGSWVNTSLGYSQLDGTFEVVTMAPMASPVGDSEGIAWRCNLGLQEVSDAIYAWDGMTEEEDVDVYEYVYDDTGVKPVGVISIETGDTVNLDTGGTIVPRVKYIFSPSESANISSYQWQFAPQGEGYSDTASIDPDADDGAGDIFVYGQGVAGEPYDFRVRAASSAGLSDWVEFLGAVPVVGVVIDIPIDGTATSNIDEITVSFRTPNDSDFKSIEFFGSDTGDSEDAVIIGEQIFASQNSVVSITESDLPTSKTRFYFARSRGLYSNTSDFTASVSATTDP